MLDFRDTMKRHLLACCFVVCLLGPAIRADTLTYTYSGTLESLGADWLGLDGASFVLTSTFTLPAVWGSSYNSPWLTSDSTEIVISGAPNSASDITEQFPGVGYAPRAGSLYTHIGNFLVVTFPGGKLQATLNTDATPTGKATTIGGSVQASDFGTVPDDFHWPPGTGGGAADYSQSGVVVSVVDATPEPSSAAFVALGLIAGLIGFQSLRNGARTGMDRSCAEQLRRRIG